MHRIIKLIKLFSDPLRMRILMLLSKRELCVCQIMAITGASQPRVSRNLGLMRDAGLLKVRREGKLLFYSLSDEIDVREIRLIDILMEMLKDDPVIKADRKRFVECSEFQKRTGRCDMKTLKRFMEEVHG